MSKKDNALRTICKRCGAKIKIIKEDGHYVQLDDLKEGDQNTNIYHKCPTQKSKKQKA